MEELLWPSLKDASSKIVTLLVEQLRGLSGFEAVTATEVVACVADLPPPKPPVSLPPLRSESEEVLIVPAADAWTEYLKLSVYICQPNRSFRSVSRMAFYHDCAIERSVPRILDVVEEIELSEPAIKKDGDITESQRTRLLALVDEIGAKGAGHRIGEKCKVIFLSPDQSADTLTLPKRIENDTKTQAGKPWGFVVNQRYVPLKRLLAGPVKTSELLDND